MNINNLDSINEHFKLPIFYNKEKMVLKDNIINDLELVKTVDASNNCIYDYIFNTKSKENPFTEKIIEQISKCYTTDKDFLKDTQVMLKTYRPPENKLQSSEIEIAPSTIIELWKEIKDDTGFKERYHYIDWSMWESLNTCENFLQILSVYTMASPVISLITPLIILIIPFFIIKLKGLPVTVTDYIKIIKIVVSNHALGNIGKLFTDFNSISSEQKLYISLSIGFYFFSIYQNILTCIRFHENMKKIHNYIDTINSYLEQTIFKMNHLLSYTDNLNTYNEFNKVFKENIQTLDCFRNKISSIGKYKLTLNKLMTIGVILKNFYDFYDNKNLNNAFLYSFGFNGYYHCLEGLIKNIHLGNINYTTFSKKKGKNIFRKSYYASLVNLNPIKNDIKFQKNIIITGPNASGKTTILKTTLINIILSQQFGCGFYTSAKLYPYKYIHCYLNIPDTSGRDSLFQSEVRRCKEIITTITENSEETHFCVFDELYSGTNPEEAIISSTAFMEYLVKFKNVFCMLTTHFTKVCYNLDSNSKILNFHMDVDKVNESLKYKYCLKEGISEVKGGIKVLYDMEYPTEIINSLKTNNQNKLEEKNILIKLKNK